MDRLLKAAAMTPHVDDDDELPLSSLFGEAMERMQWLPSYSNPDAYWVLLLVNDVTVVCMGCNVFIVVFRV